MLLTQQLQHFLKILWQRRFHEHYLPCRRVSKLYRCRVQEHP